MFLRFNKSTGISLFTLGLITSMIFKKYIYGATTLIFSFMIGLQYTLLQSDNATILKYINFTAIPGYIMFFLLSVLSLYITYQSTAIDTVQKIGSVTPFLLAWILTGVIYKFSSRFPLLERDFVKMIPMLFFFLFVLTTAIIPDNQDILRRKYAETVTDTETIKQQKESVSTGSILTPRVRPPTLSTQPRPQSTRNMRNRRIRDNLPSLSRVQARSRNVRRV